LFAQAYGGIVFFRTGEEPRQIPLRVRGRSVKQSRWARCSRRNVFWLRAN